MASIDEFITSVQSNVEALKQAQTSMDGAKQQAEELSSQFQALGAESMATGAQGLKDGVEQAQSGVTPVITRLEQLITQAQGLKSLRGSGGATHTRPPPTPLDSAPAALKEPVAKVGDQVTAPEGSDDGGAFDRLLRRSDDVHDATKSTSAAVQNIFDALQGPKPTHVGTGDPGPIYQRETPATGKPDPILTLAMGSLMVARAIQLYRTRRKDRNDD